MVPSIIVCGKSFIACWALWYLWDMQKISGSPDISAVPNQGDVGVDTWEPSLVKCAKKLGIRVTGNIAEGKRTPNGIILSLEYDKIIRTHEIGSWRAYNIHFSALPKYRGCLTSVWPIRNGETTTGVTIHVITPRIDAGPIVDQILFDIKPFVTSFDLYGLYQKYGFTLFKKNIRKLLSGKKLHTRRQREKGASYYRRSSVDFQDRTISNFRLPARALVNHVRSLIFKPYQLPVFHGKKVIACDMLSLGNRPAGGDAGTVVVEDAYHAVIVCLDGYVRVFFEGQSKFWAL